MNEGVLSVIGGTPLIQLRRVLGEIRFPLYAKLEILNPGGSIKDRPALAIIKRGIETGVITPKTVVIESSSGNMGIGLAQVCSYFGLRFICVVDPKTTSQNIRLLEAYGAEVDLVSEPDPATGEFLQARIERAQSLLALVENSFWPDQYSNLNNSLAHQQTMHEIATALNHKVDYLFCAASTCGTLRGCAEYVKLNNLGTKIIAVDAVRSVIFGGKRGKRLLPGHGAAVKPALHKPGLAHRVVHVSDLDCVVGCRRLARHEAILVGGSSGAALMAIERFKEEITDNATCVAIFPDRGERYLETIYDDTWVAEHFGDVARLWSESVGRRQCSAVY